MESVGRLFTKKNTIRAKAANVLGRPFGNLADKYDLSLEPIKGQEGVASTAMDRFTCEEVVVKSVAKRSLMSKRELVDLRREIAVMHHLGQHPNIVTLRDVVEDKHHVNLVLDPCKGGELFDRIATKGHFSERAAAHFMKDVLSAVAFCHSCNVAHRDLKPENLLLVEDREDSSLKISDFGLATFFTPGEILKDTVGSAYYIAPEVLKGVYGPECDIWSCGVILYMLLSGSPPFWGETDKQIFTEVLKGTPDLESDPWPRISRSAKDLVRSMLSLDRASRISAEDALKHPWISGSGAPDTPIAPDIVARLKNFSGANKMKKLALKVIACNLPREEILGLRTIFKQMDKDGSGSITFNELKAGLRRLGNKMPDDQLRQIMEAVDVDGNGKIDYVEFITNTIELNQSNMEDLVRKAFEHFDKDGNGSITVSELREALQSADTSLKPGELDQIIDEVDTDGNGVIDYDEFLVMMRKNS